MNSNRIERWLMSVRPAFLAVSVKKLLGVKRRVVATDAGEMLIDPVTVFGQAVMDSGGYESDMRSTIDTLLPDKGSFLDIGANEGFFTLYASKKAEQVIAIEPQQRAADCIRENLKLNQTSNVQIHQVALGNANGQRDFHLASDTNTGSSGFVSMVRYSVPKVQVEVSTLDALMQDLSWPLIDLAKIDIEGAEYELLQGAKETLQKGLIKKIAIELHPNQLAKQGYSSEQVLKILSDNAYHEVHGSPTLVYARDATV